MPIDDKNKLDLLHTATDLRKLDLSYTDSPEANLADYSVLASLTNLEELILRRTQIRDLSLISNLTNLKVLDLSFCQHIKSYEPLTNLPELHTLHCRYYENQRRPSLAPLKCLKKLQNINSGDF